MCRRLYLFQKRAIGCYKSDNWSSSGTELEELINIRFRTSVFVSFSASKRFYIFRFVTFFVFSPVSQIQKQSSANNLVSFRQSPFFEYRPGRDALQNINRRRQISSGFGTDLFLPKPFCRFCRLHLPYVSVGEISRHR